MACDSLSLATGQPVKQLLQLQATARPAFHRASQRIAICTTSGVSIIDWPTGRLVSELPQQTHGGLGIAWHPSGEAVAICGLADGVELWNVAGRRLLTRFPQSGMITRPHFSHDGGLLWTQCDWSGELRLWNTGTREEVLHSWEKYAFVADGSESPGDFLVQLRPKGWLSGESSRAWLPTHCSMFPGTSATFLSARMDGCWPSVERGASTSGTSRRTAVRLTPAVPTVLRCLNRTATC